MNQSEMTEREMIEDGFRSQMRISAGYQTYANECSDEQLRAIFLNSLMDELDLSAQIYDKIRGWYQTDQAKQSNISKYTIIRYKSFFVSFHREGVDSGKNG